ncbi:MAG TPA: 4-(cytidine 5'-diphospho)-2-C-methyl-D-erythritol kinase [Verrucomicrobiae bacterium]|nr:4-(cytidine 5'-diphospho)-2-C-methyl-D-erythritol kinase [Verrucomicrobiae bacterium]
MTNRTWPAPAKLNLFLHITGRRADGFHELQTVFQFLDFGDELRIEVASDGAVRRSADVVGVAETADLTLRAARALRGRTGCTLGCTITLDKRIPLGGGLGGGSSDAATVLVALNQLWRLHLPPDELASIGVTLGADVPVFVRGRAAWAEGIGEKLTPVEPPQQHYLVITPDCAVDTRAMYAAPDLPRATPRVSWDDFTTGRTRNDFEAPVRARHPAVAAALDWAGSYGRARLSGSGASVFVDFADDASAREAHATLPRGWRGFVARGLNRSPLLEGLA